MFIYLFYIFIVYVILRFYLRILFWKRQKIKYLTPWPFFGSFISTSLKLKTFSGNVKDNYNSFPNEKVVGEFMFEQPSLMVRDPDLIRQIMIKDFDNFVNHSKMFFEEDVDPILCKNLFALQDNKWKKIRSILSPSFTGNKIRGMFELILECGEQLNSFLSEKIKGRGELEIDLKSISTRFANDIIATTAFGLKIDSLRDPKNQFYLNGKEAVNFPVWRVLLLNYFPQISKLIKQGLIPKKIETYFSSVILSTIKERQNKNIVRHDMLNLLMEAKKNSEELANKNEDTIVLTYDDIIAQAFIFFIAGYETTSSTISFTLFELSLNQDVQAKLKDEIDQVANETNGKVSYDDICNMKYLEMVIAEANRKWTIVAETDRICIKDYVLKLDSEKKILIKAGTRISLPMIGIHNDPKYYENPEVFNPERFSPENKAKMHPCIYFPFGEGPRRCIGLRFALLEIKVFIFNMIKNYQVIPSKNLKMPLKIKKGSVLLKTEDESILVTLKERK